MVDDDKIDWKSLALYLADCHAATAYHEGQMTRTSKSSRDRFASICTKAADILEGDEIGPRQRSDYQGVLQRLRSAASALTEKGPPR